MKRKYTEKTVDFDMVSPYKRTKREPDTYTDFDKWIYAHFNLKRKFFLMSI